MSDISAVRVGATHDFCCAYGPSPTSYGSLPGGEDLRKTVDKLRKQGPTIRAVAGDFRGTGGACYPLRRRGGLRGGANFVFTEFREVRENSVLGTLHVRHPPKFGP
jgi:hypothetical protein